VWPSVPVGTTWVVVDATWIAAGVALWSPAMHTGAYIFLHDYYSAYPVAQAVRDSGIPDFVELPDKSGSIIFRKRLVSRASVVHGI
jgi:hypothetical protein